MADTTSTVASSMTLPGSGNGQSSSSDSSELEVEIWGPSGSGKTALLASLYETLDKMQLLKGESITRTIRRARDQLILGKPTAITNPERERAGTPGDAEQLSTLLPIGGGKYRRVRITSNAGEDILIDKFGNIDASKWVEERRGKVFVACLNPFRIDTEIAWKALQHLIAVLQSESIKLNFLGALESACWTLFQIQPDTIRERTNLNKYANAFNSTTLVYDPTQIDPLTRFRWDRTNEVSKTRLITELRQLISDNIRLQGPITRVVREAIEGIDNVTVVLTHVDLIDALLPSITFSDLERIFNDLFKSRPGRLVSQQALARLLRIEVSPPFDDMEFPSADLSENGDIGSLVNLGTGALLGDQQPPHRARPTEDQKPNQSYLNQSAIKGYLRDDGAAQMINYLLSLAKTGAEAPEIKVERLSRRLSEAENLIAGANDRQAQVQSALDSANGQISRLQQNLSIATNERTALSQEVGRRTSELAIKDGDIARLTAEGNRLTALQNEATEEIKKKQQEVGALNARIQELMSAKTSLDEEKKKNTELRGAHDQLNASYLQLQQQVVALSKGSSVVEELESQLLKANAERDLLKPKIRKLEEDLKVFASSHPKDALEKAMGERDQLQRQLDEARQQLQAAQVTSENRKAPVRLLAENESRNDQRYQEMLSDRETMIETLRAQKEVLEVKIRGMGAEATGRAGERLPPDELRARDTYEMNRLGMMKIWATLMLRSLPILPIIACLIWLGLKSTFKLTESDFHIFLLASIITLAGTAVAMFTSVLLQGFELSPRWIWLRSMNTRTRLLEALTSAGEKLTSSPTNFTLNKSPFLSLLGVGVIRRNDTGQKYVTSEPGAWLAAPERPALRWQFALDFMTVVLVSMWVALMVIFARH